MTLDNKAVKVLRKEDYQYYVISASVISGDRINAELWRSPACSMSNDEIAGELERLARWVRSIR